MVTCIKDIFLEAVSDCLLAFNVSQLESLTIRCKAGSLQVSKKGIFKVAKIVESLGFTENCSHKVWVPVQDKIMIRKVPKYNVSKKIGSRKYSLRLFKK